MQDATKRIDILVEVERPIGLKFFELWDKLEDMLGCKIDLVTTRAVKQKPILEKHKGGCCVCLKGIGKIFTAISLWITILYGIL